jgi:hypothetical protein
MLLLLSKVRVELLRVGVADVVAVVVAALRLTFICIQRVVNVLVHVVTHL